MNKIYIGNYNINKAYLGGDLTIKIYLGDNLVYPIEDAVAITFYDDSGNTATINCDDLVQSGRISYSDTESFQGTSYTSAVVGDCVTIIGGYSLPYQLTALTLSDSVEELEPNDSVPQNCVTLVCGTGLTTVGGYCMEFRTSIQSVTFNGSTPPTFNTNWEKESNKTFTIYVPCDAIEAYRTALSGKTANLNDRLQCIPTVQNKWELTFANGDVRNLECNASGDSFPRQIDDHDWIAPLTPFDATHAKSGVTSAVIGDCVAGILTDGFNGFTSLSSVTVNPNTMYVYGGYSGMTPGGCCAFAGDYSLVEFPYSSVLESIGRDSFHGCSGLTDATIASSCTYIGDEAFFDCTGLEKVVMEGSTPPALGGDFVFWKIDSNAPSGVSQLDIDIEVPCDAVNTYKTAPRWSAYADRITCQAPPHDYSQDYLTIESTSNNNTISLVASNTAITRTISASTDNGVTWTEYTSSTGDTQIATLNVGDKVLVKGENSTYATSFSTYSTRYNYFTSSGQFNAYGNIMSLISGDSFVNADTLTANYTFGGLFSGCTGLTSAENLILPATTLEESCYRYMFQGCTSLTRAPSVLPATTLALAFNCYESMFKDCTSLTTAPELPATTLANSCYQSMFAYCSNLTVAPELPATTMRGYYCYRYMFQGCTSLTTAPELPATTLTESCYGSMFSYCENLTTAPELPATTLAASCYREMFDSCTNLTTAPELPATTLANDCYRSMFYGCESLTTAPELPATTLAAYCYRSMFLGCTNLTTAPELPATTLTESCYQSMFQACESLNYIKCLATDISATNCTFNWVNGVASTGTFVKAASMNDWTTGTSGIPTGWTVQNDDGSLYIDGGGWDGPIGPGGDNPLDPGDAD